MLHGINLEEKKNKNNLNMIMKKDENRRADQLSLWGSHSKFNVVRAKRSKAKQYQKGLDVYLVESFICDFRLPRLSPCIT